MSIEAMKQIQQCLKDKMYAHAEMCLAEAIAEAEKQEPVTDGKLSATLKDTQIEIELAQYKRMFGAACDALGAINEALGLDPDDGGAEPILSAIEELKAAQPKRELLTDDELDAKLRPTIQKICRHHGILNGVLEADLSVALSKYAHGIKGEA
ncbi:hypothetical protein [Limnohabitans sp.]|uniref:hypothetical protein n=1 Tax=Limnohabitans sp. TaxID=1907725 RepID=UPI00286F34CB|nr:hypothetical protein [Limnohabitans sp.]